jgi:1,4-alpha-glucan branching enzyme
MPHLNEQDAYLFAEGSHFDLHRTLGAHCVEYGGVPGADFAVWAPNAEYVSVVGDFNGWNRDSHPMMPSDAGVWTTFVRDVGRGTKYKYFIRSKHAGYEVEKADPFGFHHETPPHTASIVWDLDYEWGDDDWMQSRGDRQGRDQPMSVYEVHLGSWRRIPEDGGRSLSYRELARPLAEYCADMGFTHVELLPIMEHPFYGSWGYQTTGYFAPTSRLGTPQDFKYLVDTLHEAGVGILLDWVPSHFPEDQHGLAFFDGTHLFEHADPRQGFHPDWKSSIFNYGRKEVQSFLISSAMFWLDEYHIDGLRVDAVASMLYLDYSRDEGEWIPNEYGGRENLEAIAFLRRLNTEVYRRFEDVHTVAEESTSWPMVSRPTYVGGLGFGMKWDMGWMHDTLEYMKRDPIHRRYHHHELTFRSVYQFDESFMLPLSHDEVVHGKGSLWGRMPGDEWQKRANLRLLFAYMWAQPGKKLLFMGGEFGQHSEWAHDHSLDWHLLDDPGHEGIRQLVGDLNDAYLTRPQLGETDFDHEGFKWVVADDADQSVVAFLRGTPRQRPLLCVFNFTPVPRTNFRLGVPRAGTWHEVLNTDAETYGGSGVGNLGAVTTDAEPAHGHPCSIEISLPPLGALFFEPAAQT